MANNPVEVILKIGFPLGIFPFYFSNGKFHSKFSIYVIRKVLQIFLSIWSTNAIFNISYSSDVNNSFFTIALVILFIASCLASEIGGIIVLFKSHKKMVSLLNEISHAYGSSNYRVHQVTAVLIFVTVYQSLAIVYSLLIFELALGFQINSAMFTFGMLTLAVWSVFFIYLLEMIKKLFVDLRRVFEMGNLSRFGHFFHYLTFARKFLKLFGSLIFFRISTCFSLCTLNCYNLCYVYFFVDPKIRDFILRGVCFSIAFSLLVSFALLVCNRFQSAVDQVSWKY